MDYHKNNQMKEYHEGMEHLGPLETTRKTIEVSTDWLDYMSKEELERLLKTQIEHENYEAAEIIKQKISKI